MGCSFSCAAGGSLCPLLLVLSGSLAALAYGGRRGPRLRALMAPLFLALTTSALMPLVWPRQAARITATPVSPSAALVLY